MGVAWFMTGETELATKNLDELLGKSNATSIGSPSYFAAAIYVSMGQVDKALSMLGKAIRENEVEIYWLKVEPLFNKLHSDTRFEKLIEKIRYN